MMPILCAVQLRPVFTLCVNRSSGPVRADHISPAKWGLQGAGPEPGGDPGQASAQPGHRAGHQRHSGAGRGEPPGIVMFLRIPCPRCFVRSTDNRQATHLSYVIFWQGMFKKSLATLKQDLSRLDADGIKLQEQLRDADAKLLDSPTPRNPVSSAFIPPGGDGLKQVRRVELLAFYAFFHVFLVWYLCM